MPIRTRGAGGDRGGEGEGLGEVAVVEQVVLGQPDRVRAEAVGLLADISRVKP